jgi:hypothetical protein
LMWIQFRLRIQLFTLVQIRILIDIWCGCGPQLPKWCGPIRIRIHYTG